MNQNSCVRDAPKSKKRGNSAVENVSTSVEDENSDEMPMTIKIDPPYIRDIDEDEDSDEVLKDGTPVRAKFQSSLLMLDIEVVPITLPISFGFWEVHLTVFSIFTFLPNSFR